MIHHCKFQNVAEAEQALFNYIEVYYNRQRKHSTNGYKSPAHFELEWWNNKKGLTTTPLLCGKIRFLKYKDVQWIY